MRSPLVAVIALRFVALGSGFALAWPAGDDGLLRFLYATAPSALRTVAREVTALGSQAVILRQEGNAYNLLRCAGGHIEIEVCALRDQAFTRLSASTFQRIGNGWSPVVAFAKIASPRFGSGRMWAWRSP